MSTTALTQTARILKHLKEHGKVTNVELNRMGIYRYSARVHDLRREGYDIRAVHVKDGLWEFVYMGHRDDEK